MINYLLVYNQFGPRLTILQGTLPWQPNLGKISKMT